VKIIYTKHALDRIHKRRLSERDIEDAIRCPDKKFPTQNEAGNKYIKQLGTRRYHVVAKYLPEQKSYLVVSAWVRGEEDQPDLAWRLLVAPFKFGWWVIKKIFVR
jgi:hypothetical protein